MSNINVPEVECVEQYGWNHFFFDNTIIKFKRFDKYTKFLYIKDDGMNELKVKNYLVPETLEIIEKEFKIKLRFY